MNLQKRLSNLAKWFFGKAEKQPKPSDAAQKTKTVQRGRHHAPPPSKRQDPLNVSVAQVVIESQSSNRLKNAVRRADEAGLLPKTLADFTNDRNWWKKAGSEVPNFTGGTVFELEMLLDREIKRRTSDDANYLFDAEVFLDEPSMQPSIALESRVMHSRSVTAKPKPPSWDDIIRHVQKHRNLADQYIWLTAQHIHQHWPSELFYLQLKDLRDKSASELKRVVDPYIQKDNEIELLTTLNSVLNYWGLKKSQISELDPESMASHAIFTNMPRTSSEVLFRRLESEDTKTETLIEIGNSLELSRERIRQIEAKALDWLNQSPQREFLKILLHSCRDELESLLLGVDGCSKKTKLSNSTESLSLIKSLAVRCLYKSLDQYAKSNLVEFGNLYIKSGVDKEHLNQDFVVIEGSIDELSLPIHIEVAAAELNVSAYSLTCYATSKSSHGSYDDYLHEGRTTPRKQRAIRLVRMISGSLGGGPATFGKICSTYRFAFPNATCSIRDIRSSVYEYADQFLPLTDNGFASISRVCELEERKKVENAFIPDLDDAEYRAFNVGTLYAEISDLVEEIGPAPLLEIRSEFEKRFSDKWSPNSVFPVLKSTNYFVRMAPGIIGTLPMVKSASKLKMSPHLQSEIQIKYYIYAKMSQSRFTYPLWHSNTEYQWCKSGDGVLPGHIYTSLLAVVNPDKWKVPEEEKNWWRSRIASEAKFALTIKPLPLDQIVPTVRDICTLAVFIGDNSSLSWLDINRVLGYRIDSRSSMSFLAVLNMLGIVNVKDYWLLPIEVCPRAAYRFLNEIVCNHRLNCAWCDIPDFKDSQLNLKSKWFNARELEELLQQMRSVRESTKPNYQQTKIPYSFDLD